MVLPQEENTMDFSPLSLHVSGHYPTVSLYNVFLASQLSFLGDIMSKKKRKKRSPGYSVNKQLFNYRLLHNTCPPPLSCLFTLESKYAGCRTLSDASFPALWLTPGLDPCGFL